HQGNLEDTHRIAPAVMISYRPRISTGKPAFPLDFLSNRRCAAARGLACIQCRGRARLPALHRLSGGSRNPQTIARKPWTPAYAGVTSHILCPAPFASLVLPPSLRREHRPPVRIPHPARLRGPP